MPKMYVLVRKDMSGSYSAVQGGHALAEYLLHNPEALDIWQNRTLIYLGVEGYEELWDYYCKANKITEAEYFDEPDIGNQTTAFAALDTPDKELEELFKKLPLL